MKNYIEIKNSIEDGVLGENQWMAGVLLKGNTSLALLFL